MLEALTELDIYEMDIETAYTTLQTLKIDYPINKKTEEQIKNGIKTEFYIGSYLKGNYQWRRKNHKYIIDHTEINEKEFDEEIDTREALIKKTIKDLLDQPESTQARQKID